MKKPGLVIKIAIGIAIVIVIGAIAAISILIWDPFWSPFRPSPKEASVSPPQEVLPLSPVQQILKEASVRFEELKTFHFEVFFEQEIIQLQQKAIKRSMTINGALDNTNKEEPKWKGKTKIETIFNETQFSLGWEKIIIGENSWFKLTTLPPSQFLKLFTFDLEKIKDQWIKLGKNSFKDLFGELSIQSEMKVVKKIIANEKLFHLREILPDEKINGKEAYHYLFHLDEREFKKLIPGISKISPLEPKEFEEFEEVLAEIWIGKEDKLIYKAKIDSQKQEPEPSFGKRMVMKIEIYLSEFNMPLEIKPPQQFELFEDIFGTKDLNFFSFPEQF